LRADDPRWRTVGRERAAEASDAREGIATFAGQCAETCRGCRGFLSSYSTRQRRLFRSPSRKRVARGVAARHARTVAMGLLTSLLCAGPLSMLYGAKSEGGIKGSVGRMKEYFTDQGLTAADLPAALIFHEAISVGFAAFTWSACYGIQPSVTIARPMAGLPGASKVAGAFDRALAFSDKKVAGMKWLKKVPVVKHATPRRLTVSLAESLVFRGSIKPITFGVKLYVSYKFVVWGKNRTRASRPACLSLALPPSES